MITVEEIEHAMKIAAKVVSLYGETYLPIFNRLHAEFLKVQETEKTKMLAFRIAKQYDETINAAILDGTQKSTRQNL